MVQAVREENSFLYKVAWVLARVVFTVFLPVKVYGRKKLNGMEPPYVLIANHQHALDPVIMAATVRKHQCVFLGKKELGKSDFLRKLLANVHCILVDRHHADMEAMRACMKAMKLKKPLVIFPEGTRHHEGQMEQIENGTSLIALRCKAPVVPMYFDRKMRFFRMTHLYVGDPITTADLLEEGITTATCEKMNERMRETYRQMIREHGHFPE